MRHACCDFSRKSRTSCSSVPSALPPLLADCGLFVQLAIRSDILESTKYRREIGIVLGIVGSQIEIVLSFAVDLIAYATRNSSLRERWWSGSGRAFPHEDLVVERPFFLRFGRDVCKLGWKLRCVQLRCAFCALSNPVHAVSRSTSPVPPS